jgi:multisubunit Na+/H+ antiporter MnhE subunit
MLNKVAVFLLLFVTWTATLFLLNIFNYYHLFFGFVASLVSTFFVFGASIIVSDSKFLFLQFGFYKYIFTKMNTSLTKVFKLCLEFMDADVKFTSILDYVFLNKDSDSNAVLCTNILTLMPATLGILMKKRYLIVHSIDKDYFSLGDMYNISVEVEKIDDDSLV